MSARNPVADLADYDLRHLLAHLEEIGQVETIHRVLRLEWQAEGGHRRNAWFERKNDLGDLDAYVNDVRRAWRCASTIVLQLRYALTIASINSRVGNVPPALLAAQVVHGQVSFEQALAFIQQMPDNGQRVRSLSALAPEPLQARQKRLVDVALAIQDKSDAASALAALIPRLDEDVLRRAEEALAALPASPGRSAAYLAVARRVTDDRFDSAARQALSDAFEIHGADRAEALANLAEFVQEPSLGEMMGHALDAAMSVERHLDRANAVARLAPTLARAGYTQLAGSVVDTFKVRYTQLIVLRSLAPFLPEGTLRNLLSLARKEDKDFPVGSLWWVALHLPEPERGDLLATIVRTSLPDEQPGQRLRRLAHVIPDLEAPLLEEALPPILATSSWNDGEVLAAWCDRMSALGHPRRALDIADVADQPFARARTFAAIAPYFGDGSPERRQALNEVLKALRANTNREQTGRLLDQVAPILPAETLHDAARIISAIGDDNFQAFAVAAAASHLPETEREAVVAEVYRAVLMPGTGRTRAFALVVLFGSLADVDKAALLPVVFQEIRASKGETREILLATISAALPDELLDAALDLLHASDDPAFDAPMLMLLAPRLAGERLTRTFEWVTARVDEKWDRAAGAIAARLAELAPGQSPTLLERGASQSRRAALLHLLAQHLPDSAVPEETRLVEAMDSDCRSTLMDLYPRLAQLSPASAITRARAETDPSRRAQLLFAMAPRLPAPEREQAIDEAFQAWEGTTTADAQLVWLSAVAASEDGLWRERAVDAARAIVREIDLEAEPVDDDVRSGVARGLKDLSRWVAEPEKTAWLRIALSAATKIYLNDIRPQVLNDLASALPEPLLREAIAHALELDEKGLMVDPRAHALRGLLPCLADMGYLEEALALTQRVEDPIDCALIVQLVVEGKTVDAAAWHAVVRALGQRQRGHVLAALYVLAPAVVRLDGPAGMSETLRAVRDVCAWWP